VAASEVGWVVRNFAKFRNNILQRLPNFSKLRNLSSIIVRRAIFNTGTGSFMFRRYQGTGTDIFAGTAVHIT
jgi:hypothetical protein